MALPPYSDDPRTTEELLNHDYATDPATAKVFQALNAGERKLPPWFKKNAYYFSLSDCQTTGTGDERRLFIDGTRLYIPPMPACVAVYLIYATTTRLPATRAHAVPFISCFPDTTGQKWHSPSRNTVKPAQCVNTLLPREMVTTDSYGPSTSPKDLGWISPLITSKIYPRPRSTARHTATSSSLWTASPSDATSSKEFAEHFMHIFRLHGLPRTIVSDRGTSFVNRF